MGHIIPHLELEFPSSVMWWCDHPVLLLAYMLYCIGTIIVCVEMMRSIVDAAPVRAAQIQTHRAVLLITTRNYRTLIDVNSTQQCKRNGHLKEL